MLQVDAKNSTITSSQIQNIGKKLIDYSLYLLKVSNEKDYIYDECSINLCLDQDLLSKSLKLKNTLISNKLKYIVVIGMGGSILGTKGIYDSLYGKSCEIIVNPSNPKMIFLDFYDPDFLDSLKTFLISSIFDPSEILFNFVTKSGTTIETIMNFEFIINNFPQLKSRIIVTTSNPDLFSKYKEISILDFPQKVGGRYSIFSPVGIFPLACCGVNIANLLKGSIDTRKICLNPDFQENPAILSAILIYLNYKQRKTINDNFFFSHEMESIGKWYRQLMAESTGKKGKGLTPTVSIAPQDMHSMAQLYFGGPKDKFFTFVWFNKYFSNTFLQNIYQNITQFCEKDQIPFMRIVLNEINEYSLGEYFQFKMIEMMYLCKLLNVNAFDQPDVEKYKIKAKNIKVL